MCWGCSIARMKPIGSAEVIAALDHFADARAHHLTLVILDNAPIHHSEAVTPCLERWLANGVGVHFLPPYCPELNRIEILWRKIKYDGLPFSAYTSFATLKEALLAIFSRVGSTYQIMRIKRFEPWLTRATWQRLNAQRHGPITHGRTGPWTLAESRFSPQAS